MAKGSFRFPLYTGGSTPDPAVFCPAEGYILPEDCPVPDPAVFCPSNGYIPDEPGAGNWELVARYKTNSPGTTTFDPILYTDPSTYAGKIAWKVGSTIYYERDLSIVMDGSLQDVELYVLKGSGLVITSFYADSDHIVGVLDLTFLKPNPSANTIISVHSNAALTSIKFNSLESFKVQTLFANNCGIQGIIDLSFISELYFGNIQLHYNANLEGVIFPNSILSGKLKFLYVNNCNLKYPLDISAFDFETNSAVRLNSNPNLESVIFPTAISGTISQLYLYSCNLKILDLSIILSKLTTSANVNISGNVNLASILMPSSATGKLNTLNVSYSKINEIDLSGIDFTDTAVVNLNNISDLSTVVFKIGGLGKFTQFNVSYCNITDLDFTQIPNCINKSSVSIYLNNNSMAASIVDKLLFDLAAIAATDPTNYTSRLIQIGGGGATANAAPTDGSVTGYDGLTAKAYLISRAISVTSN